MAGEKVLNFYILDIINLIYKDKKVISLYSVIAGVLGIIIAFTTPKIYKSTVMLAPEESGQGFSGSLSSIASMVGMNMKIGQTGDALYPEIYPELMGSTDFIIGLFDVKIKIDKTNEEHRYFDYLLLHQKTALIDYPIILIDKIVMSFKEKKDVTRKGRANPFRLTKTEFDIYKKIQGNINCSVDKKTDVITITVTDQDPLVAATVADSVKQHLQMAITEYRTKKARIDVEYMEEIYAEAKKQYDNARLKFASSSDANINAVFMSYKIKQKEMENDMQMKYNIYTTVAEQLQLAKAKVQEKTPAFTVVQSASVPLKHSSRSKIVTLIIWMMLGFMLRCGMLVWKNRKMLIKV